MAVVAAHIYSRRLETRAVSTVLCDQESRFWIVLLGGL